MARTDSILQGYFGWRQNFEFELKRIILHWIQTVSFEYSEVIWNMSFLNIRWVIISELIYTIKHHQDPWTIPLDSIDHIRVLNSNKINGFWQWIKKWVQLLIRFYNDTVCIHDHNITLQRVHIGTWNQIIFKLAKHMHPTQRSHSKTHWICIEIFQTKHEAWGCFKLNTCITPLYNKKWSSGLLVFFPYME